ncbi:MAG: hypothetical protein CVV22_03540 [Ignavibacteriae bacterium HGW-Ignavibacteriae-1]|jgi:hypothetical protein|nr:MAG: hypothetical protein CVV22_03540 [Ignavibacteriae bacterium HGW-Ignavibacteriae-1]
MKLRILPVLLISAVFSTLMVFGQSDEDNPIMPVYEEVPIYIGPVFGYNRSIHSVDLASFDEAICPRFQDGNDNGFYVGFSFEHHLGKDATLSTSSFIFRVLYSTMPAFMETSEAPIPSLITIVDGNGDPIGEDIINSSTRHTQQVDYSVVSAEVCYKINPIPGMGLGFTIGPTFDFALTKTQDQRYELLTPLEAQFRRNQDAIDQLGYKYVDNDQVIIIKEGDIPNSNAFRLGIKAGVQYEILFGTLVIVPAMYYNYGVTNLSSQESWRVNALQVGVDLRWAVKLGL